MVESGRPLACAGLALGAALLECHATLQSTFARRIYTQGKHILLIKSMLRCYSGGNGSGVVVTASELLMGEPYIFCDVSLAVEATASHALWYASKDNVALHCTYW